MRKAVFPGSFDPVTYGHVDIVLRALPLFDEIVVAIGSNSSKSYMFDLEKRIELIQKAFNDHPKVTVHYYQGLTVNFCENIGAKFILRGIRNSADYEFERAIAGMNKKIYPEIETVFILSDPEKSIISSTIVRDIIKNGGDVSQFVPSLK